MNNSGDPPELCPPFLYCVPLIPLLPSQVHEEFKQNVENIGTEMLLRRFAESKGTGRERPGEVGGSPLSHQGDAPRPCTRVLVAHPALACRGAGL